MEKFKVLLSPPVAKKSPELLAGIKGIELTPVSLAMSKEATLDGLKVFGERLGARVRSYQWWIGDMFHQGEARFGERFHQISDATGLSYEYLNKVKSVASKVAPQERRASLPFSFHFIVSSLLPKEQKTFLDLAERHKMTREELAAEVREFKQGIEAPRDEAPGSEEHENRGEEGGENGFYHDPDEDENPLDEFDVEEVTRKVLELLEPASELEVKQVIGAIQRRYLPARNIGNGAGDEAQ
jgi:hypothetical protein